MRLDTYLVENNLVPTKSKAQRAIKEGLVTINGIIVTKPSKVVKETDYVDIKDQKLAGMPSGYYKLKALQEKLGIIKPTDIVLDLGSSAGGYLMFASEIATEIFGIEFSEEFRKPLEKIVEKCPNVHVVFGDVFHVDPNLITDNKEVDLILNDLTVNWMASIEGLGNVLTLLKQGGRILMTLKLSGETAYGVEELVRKMFESHSLTVTQFLELDNEKEEVYVIAKKT